MRKTLGWFYIVINSFLLLLAALLAALLMVSIYVKDFMPDQALSTKLTLILPITLSTFFGYRGLKKGLSKVRNEATKQLVQYFGKLDINISGKVDYKDYRNLILGLTFKSRHWFLICIFVLMFIFANYENSLKEILISIPIFTGLAALFGFAVSNSIKKQYKETIVLQNHMHYHLDNETIRIQGETFDSTNKWTHFMKIKETKNFFLFYHGRVATFLHKKMFNNIELNEFRKFIQSLDIPKE